MQPLAHDQWFFLLAGLLGRVTYVATPLVRYRQHDANVYGVREGDRTTRGGVRGALLAPAWADRARADSAASRSVVAEAVASRVAEVDRAGLLARARAYARLARWLGDRYDSAYAPRMLPRARALLANAGAGAYRGGDHFHFPLPWIVGDVLRTLRGAVEVPVAERA